MPRQSSRLCKGGLPGIETDEVRRAQRQCARHMHDVERARAQLHGVSRHEALGRGKHRRPRRGARKQTPLIQVGLHQLPRRSQLGRREGASEGEPRERIAQLGPAKLGQRQRHAICCQPRLGGDAE